MMTCTRCQSTVSIFSTKCQSCTADYTTGRLWGVNIIAWITVILIFTVPPLGLTLLFLLWLLKD
jgi:hypothetical protein